MRSIVPLAALVAFAVVAPASAQQTAGLSGAWQGAYISSDGSDVNTFEVTLTQRGAALSGRIVEVNTFGDTNQALFLTSTLQGTMRGAQVNFVKTYDGSGGVSHSVSYSGTLQAGGRRITGTFDASGSTGRFELVR